MDLDDSKAHLIARRYLRTDCNHSAACSVPPGTISLRLLPYMVTPPSIFGNKRSDMVPGGTADAAEWLQSVRRYLMAMGWAFESSKSIKRVKRYAISCVCHMCLGGACTLHDTTHFASYYSYYTVMHTHRVVNMFFMNYTSTVLCMDLSITRTDSFRPSSPALWRGARKCGEGQRCVAAMPSLRRASK